MYTKRALAFAKALCITVCDSGARHTCVHNDTRRSVDAFDVDTHHVAWVEVVENLDAPPVCSCYDKVRVVDCHSIRDIDHENRARRLELQRAQPHQARTPQGTIACFPPLKKPCIYDHATTSIEEQRVDVKRAPTFVGALSSFR